MTVANVPYFKAGSLMFCGDTLRASCCPSEGPGGGWIFEDDYRIRPEDPAITQWCVYCCCLIQNCDDVGSGEAITGGLSLGSIFVAECGLVSTHVHDDEFTYIFVQILGPYNSREEVCGIMAAYKATILDYAKYCICTNDCHGILYEAEMPVVTSPGQGLRPCEWWDFESGADMVGCNYGYLKVSGFWTNNGLNDRANIHLERYEYLDGTWQWNEIGNENEGSITDYILGPCEYLRLVGSVDMELWQSGDVSGLLDSDVIGNIDSENCTQELQDAFDAIPHFTEG